VMFGIAAQAASAVMFLQIRGRLGRDTLTSS